MYRILFPFLLIKIYNLYTFFKKPQPKVISDAFGYKINFPSSYSISESNNYAKCQGGKNGENTARMESGKRERDESKLSFIPHPPFPPGHN